MKVVLIHGWFICINNFLITWWKVNQVLFQLFCYRSSVVATWQKSWKKTETLRSYLYPTFMISQLFKIGLLLENFLIALLALYFLGKVLKNLRIVIKKKLKRSSSSLFTTSKYPFTNFCLLRLTTILSVR